METFGGRRMKKAQPQCQKVMRKNCAYCRGYNYWSSYWRHDFDCPVYQMKKLPMFFAPEEPCDCNKCVGDKE